MVSDTPSKKKDIVEIGQFALIFALTFIVSIGCIAFLRGITSPQDLANSNRQFQEFFRCLSSLENATKTATSDLMLQELQSGISCVENSNSPIKNEFKYKNLKSFSQELATQSSKAQLASQEKLASLNGKIILKLFNKSIAGLIFDAFILTLILLGFTTAAAMAMQELEEI